MAFDYCKRPVTSVFTFLYVILGLGAHVILLSGTGYFVQNPSLLRPHVYTELEFSLIDNL